LTFKTGLGGTCVPNLMVERHGTIATSTVELHASSSMLHLLTFQAIRYWRRRSCLRRGWNSRRCRSTCLRSWPARSRTRRRCWNPHPQTLKPDEQKIVFPDCISDFISVFYFVFTLLDCFPPVALSSKRWLNQQIKKSMIVWNLIDAYFITCAINIKPFNLTDVRLWARVGWNGCKRMISRWKFWHSTSLPSCKKFYFESHLRQIHGMVCSGLHSP